MKIQIDPLSTTRLYEQIITQIKQQIINQTLEEFTPLPSVRTLSQRLHVSIVTIRRAYLELEQEGYVITIPTKGTFVSFNYKNRFRELREAHLQSLLQEIAYTAVALELDETELLQKTKDAHRFALAQQHTKNRPATECPWLVGENK